MSRPTTRLRARLQRLQRLQRLTATVHARLLTLHRDERGDVPERTLATAVMVGLALTVTAIIVARVTGWANSIGGP